VARPIRPSPFPKTLEKHNATPVLSRFSVYGQRRAALSTID